MVHLWLDLGQCKYEMQQILHANFVEFDTMLQISKITNDKIYLLRNMSHIFSIIENKLYNATSLNVH